LFPHNVFSSVFSSSAMTTVFVNDKEIQVPSTSTVIQACELAGAVVPRFCYHDRLSVAGNCRMCLVEVEKVPKPVASCAYPLMPNMRIHTETPMVKRAREGVLEFILANHPLDCPICDQGGECDLQDQSIMYGSNLSRFREMKRAVEDKEIGPVVKMIMTRCIHCTRCVRFAEEVAGVPTLGVTGRGSNSEIGTYTPQNWDSEMSGNVVDLCPVGALTSKPFMFKARPWELTSVDSVDVMDAVGTNIKINTRGADVMRVLPRLHEGVNEEWVSDRSRLAFDGLNRQRLDTPMKRNAATGLLEPCTWSEALIAIRDAVAPLQPNEIRAVVGDLADAEGILALKDMTNALGSDNTYYASTYQLPADVRAHYTFNSSIAALDDADLVLLVGTNPRMEAPIIASRLRKNDFTRDLPVYAVGPEADFAMRCKFIGDDMSIVSQIANKSHKFAARLAQAKKPVVVFGQGFFQAAPAAATDVMSAFAANFEALGGFSRISVLQTEAARVAAQDIGFVPGPDAVSAPAPKFVYLMNADNEAVQKAIPAGAFVVYQGHNGDIGASGADVILPTTAYTETISTFVNTEGRAQLTVTALGAKGQARDNWKVIRALSEVLDVKLPYDTLPQLKNRLAMVAPTVLAVDAVEPATIIPAGPATAPALSGPIPATLSNHYLSNVIGRASTNMANCSAAFPVSRNSYGKVKPSYVLKTTPVAGAATAAPAAAPAKPVTATAAAAAAAKPATAPAAADAAPAAEKPRTKAAKAAKAE
jgi:NADH dehydrogenase (ubiquinone) Fe-S protein 1